MNYSSVAHLSNQFKKETGITPTQFKALKKKHRVSIEDVGNPSEVAIKPKIKIQK
jgi:AraC-like DNA-binding protein